MTYRNWTINSPGLVYPVEFQAANYDGVPDSPTRHRCGYEGKGELVPVSKAPMGEKQAGAEAAFLSDLRQPYSRRRNRLHPDHEQHAQV